jgi:hypothetical protein
MREKKTLATEKTTVRCERCGEVLREEKIIWLELSQTDGRYYNEIPEGHVSQGGFAFGSTCGLKEVERQ